MRDVGSILLVWLIMWLFNCLNIVPSWAKDVANGVVLVLLLLAMFGVIRL